MRPGMLCGVALALGVAGCSLARPPAVPPPARPFIVTFWCAPPLAELDDARAAEIAAAGFTTIGAPCEGGLDPEATRRGLEVAARHGLEMWVGDHRVSPLVVATPGWQERLDAAVAEYRGYPALSGYAVDDEPNADEFAAVAEVVAALRRADPAALAYVNLLPDYVPPRHLKAESYAAYLEQFVATVQPTLLSVDYYPFGEKKDRSTFFANLDALRAVALRHDLPFMWIVLAMPHGPYRDPTEAELAWQVHHALAYGARGISYFTYWTPPGGGEWNNRYGLIEHGRPTLHYFQVASLNRAARAIGAALAPYRSLAVADALGEVGVAFPLGPIAGIDGGAVTAGVFGDGGDATLVALLVNRDYRYGVSAALRLQPDATRPEVLDPDTGRWQAATDDVFPLAPGGAVLLRWRNG